MRIERGLDVGRRLEALAVRLLGEVGVAHLDRDGPHLGAVGAHAGKQLVDHPLGDLLDGGEVADVRAKRLLLRVALGVIPLGLDAAVVLAAALREDVAPVAPEGRRQLAPRCAQTGR